MKLQSTHRTSQASSRYAAGNYMSLFFRHEIAYASVVSTSCCFIRKYTSKDFGRLKSEITQEHASKYLSCHASHTRDMPYM